MSTTVIDVPKYFDEVSINRILGESRFDKGEMHPHQIADIWGFVKYFEKEGGEKSELPLSAFTTLCDRVEKEELRYEINGVGPASPNQLAMRISDGSSRSYGDELDKSQDINLDRIEEQNPPVIPDYRVRILEQKISVIFDDEVYLSKTNEIVGKDCFNNEYRIDINEVCEKLSEDTQAERYFKNGITTLEFYLQ